MKKILLLMTLLFCAFKIDAQIISEFQFIGSKDIGPNLTLSADSLFFGVIRSGATTRKFIEISNTGDETLQLSHILFSDEINYFMDQRDTLPILIEPGDTTKISIWYNPQNEQQHASDISFLSNDPDGIIQAFALGSGFIKDWQIGDIFWEAQITGDNDSGVSAIIGIKDVTGDEIEDVIVATSDNSIRCFNGNAHESGNIIWKYNIGGGSVLQQQAIATIADIDNDEYEDLVIGTAFGDNSITAISGYSGNQIWKHNTNEFGNGGWVYQLDIKYDFNGDEFPDILAATGDDSLGTGPKRVYCLNGLTGDSIWTLQLGGGVFSVIGIEDFTDDGQEDIIAGTTDLTGTQGSFYAIDGSAGKQKWHFVTQGTVVKALGQIDDINESGTKDIIAGVDNGQYIMVDPKTLFILKISNIGEFSINRFVVINDISRDFKKDILIAHNDNRAIVIDGANAGYLINEPIADKSMVVDGISDIDGDEQNDIILGSSTVSNYAYVMETYTSDILFEDDFETPVDAIKSIKDINNDLSMEIVVGGRDGKIRCYSGGLNATVGIPQNILTQKFSIDHHNFPNPFYSETNIVVDLQNNEQMYIRIFDCHGRLVSEIENGFFKSGQYSFKWKPDHSNSKGIYFYNISTPSAVVTGKLVFLK